MLTPFHYAFVQRGALELVLLSVGAGVLGTWIVLRGLAFYSHGVGAAAFPGLVLVGALALGVILASDVFHSHANIESLLFGSVLAVGDADLAVAGALSAGVV